VIHWNSRAVIHVSWNIGGHAALHNLLLETLDDFENKLFVDSVFLGDTMKRGHLFSDTRHLLCFALRVLLL
jgi:hypothetical protein